MSKWFHERVGEPCRRFSQDENPPTARKPEFEKAIVIEHETETPAGEKLPVKIVVPKISTTKTHTTKTQAVPTTKTPVTTKKGGRPKLSDDERASRRKASMAKANKKRGGK